jgi:hypothetical protein
MNTPWIIWCRQRTASNATASSLAISTGVKYKSECFNPALHQIPFVLIPSLPVGERATALKLVCDRGLCFKHVYDLLPLEFNLALAEATNRANYRHIYLVRDEFARLVSLGVAENETTWMPFKSTRDTFDRVTRGEHQLRPLRVASLIQRSHEAQAQWRHISEVLRTCLLIKSEEITARDVIKRHGVIKELLRYVGASPANIGKFDRELWSRRQHTHKVWNHIPNLNELREALQ